jgi:hypothetical protein
MVAWIVGLLLVIALYTLGPIEFNAARPAILGMPPLYFWFVLVPLLNPLIMGAVYLIDARDNVSDHVGGTK